MKNSEKKDFIAYEYLSIDVISDKEVFYMDCYENFGWQLTGSIHNNGLLDKEDYYINSTNINRNSLVNLKFKRNRKIPNKMKVIALQKKCENSLKELERLEKEPVRKGTTYAVVNAIVGTVFLTISVFSITSTIPNILLGAITGIIGFIFWGLSYPIYKKIKETQKEINTSLLEEQYDIIYNSCEQAKKLIN